MCFPGAGAAIFSAVGTALTSLVADGLATTAQNKAAAATYNSQVDYAEMVNKQAIRQANEKNSRARLDTKRQAESAADKARQAVLENLRQRATARASGGTAGIMDLSNIEQNFDALIGGVGTNFQSTLTQLDQNLFFTQLDNKLQADNISNQAIPAKPQLQGFGLSNLLAAGVAGLSAGIGTFSNTRLYQQGAPQAAGNPYGNLPPIGPELDPGAGGFYG